MHLMEEGRRERGCRQDSGGTLLRNLRNITASTKKPKLKNGLSGLSDQEEKQK